MHDLITLFGGLLAYGASAYITLLFSAYIVDRTWPENNKRKI